MAFAYIASYLYDTDNEQPLNVPRIDRRRLREIDNPFELTLTEFRRLYRLSPGMVENLVSQLDNQLRGSRITALSTEKQVLAALRFYATGCYQRPVGEQWGISMSQTSISRCIHRVTDAINNSMFTSKVKFPMTQLECQAAKEIFASAPSPFVAGTIGAIDCTHVAILAPKNNESNYVNHHGYHSMNVQMICDPNLKILNVNAKFPGARHDSFIWSFSAARRVMQRSFETGNHNTFLIGDSGYPLEPWLMTPLPNEPEGTPKFRYNEALCKARNPIERLFGVLKGTWRCLSRQRVLLYDPGFAGRVVNACATLHNVRLGDQTTAFDDRVVYDNEILSTNDDSAAPSSVAKRVQQRIIANFF
ncbi:putative nuclease HARBI1 [Rhagoletis pomonella]|uniref:putative nuclease HARBI1 n=1 Tax=Rhagoletis pomonella TaxID=28610 RepID=UPI0017846FFE|nr:putative nuclease HARBI1 [Rhagoletis pomonella]XP_036334990.1 putative nuclease HARBI1 [Rhagoletis pomonella]